jgi:hypothetical protein
VMAAMGGPALDQQAEAMKKLGENTKRTADEEERLARLKELAAQRAAAGGIKTDEQIAQERAFDAAVHAHGGSPELDTSLKAYAASVGIGRADSEAAAAARAMQADLGRQIDSGAFRDQPELLAAALEARARAEHEATTRGAAASNARTMFANEMAGAARGTAGGLEGLVRIMQEKPDLFQRQKGLSDYLGAATPAGVARAKAQEQLEEEVETDAELMTERRKARNEAKKKADAFTKSIVDAEWREGGKQEQVRDRAQKQTDAEATKATAEANRAKEKARKDGEAEAIKAANKGASEAEAEARKLTPQFSKQISRAISLNDQARMQGGGMEPDQLQAVVTEQVARAIAASGGKPELAGRVVNQSAAQHQQALAGAMARTGDYGLANAELLVQTTQQIQRLQGQQNQTQRLLMQARQNLQRNANQRPSLIGPGNR